MKAVDAVRASLSLLTTADRRKLMLVTLAQAATSALDLIGVLLVGVVAAVAIASASGSPIPSVVETALRQASLQDLDSSEIVIYLGLAAAVTLAAKSLLSIYLTRRVLRFLASRQAQVSNRLAALLLSRSLLDVTKRSSQETSFALTHGVTFATLIVLGQAVIIASEVALLLTLSVGLLYLDPVVTVFSIAFFSIVGIALQRFLSGWAHALGRRSFAAEVESLALVQEAIETYREATVTNRRSQYATRFSRLRWSAASMQSDVTFINLVPKYVFEIALVVGGSLLAASQFLLKDAAAAVGTIAVFLAAGSRVVPSILRLQGSALLIRSASGSAAETYALAQELTASSPPPLSAAAQGGPAATRAGLEMPRPFEPRLRVRDVSFTYPANLEPALHEVDLSVEPGESLALVGSSGSGKSTLADVILGVLFPDSGTVTISGVAPQMAVTMWPGAIAYVPQSVAITNASVRANIALGVEPAEIDDDLVWDALRRAHLDEFIRGLPAGPHSQVGEHGTKLSGGQRQRLGMARALYSQPQLLLLDEATSALDAETEDAITQTLRDLEGRITTITVAHRLATIRHCEKVAYLENGRILSIGTFDQVRRAIPDFAHQARLLGI